MPRCSAALSNPLHSLLSFHRRCKDTIVLTVLQPHQVGIMRHSVAFISHSPRITLLLSYSLSLLPVTLNHTETLFSLFFSWLFFLFFYFKASSMRRRHKAHCCLTTHVYIIIGELHDRAFRNIQEIEIMFAWPTRGIYLKSLRKEVFFFSPFHTFSEQSAANNSDLLSSTQHQWLSIVFHSVGSCVSRQHFFFFFQASPTRSRLSVTKAFAPCLSR